MTDQKSAAIYTIRRDVHGHAQAIERDGYTVLILACGAERNEREIDDVVAMLNRQS